MDRRHFLRITGAFCTAGVALTGCRSKQHAQVLRDDQADLVGNKAAGAETFGPLVEEAVAKLLGRHHAGLQTVSAPGEPMVICFLGVENKSSEELGDFREQLYQLIDTKIEQSHLYRPVSRRYVDAALRETRMRPDQLFVPENMGLFMATLGRYGQPINCLMYATITSGTTHEDNAFQRDYLLTMEIVNVHTGDYDKESAKIRKGYERSRMPGPVAKSKFFSWW